MSTYEDFFARYRQLMATEQALQQAQRDLERTYMKDHEILNAKHRDCNQELKIMRRIITGMIENGWDPVEAQLKMDEDMHREIMHETLWDKESMRTDNSGNWGIGTISPLTLSTLNTGMTGAVGANHPYPTTWQNINDEISRIKTKLGNTIGNTSKVDEN